MTTTTRRQVRELTAQASVVRPEIQALRAIAVLSVVLYHLWPLRLPGGFVGVDVFFAISGFLIIGHLMREVDRTGKVRLLPFWARRARRLLPASLLVLAVTGLAILAFVPTVQWQQFFSEIAASALYVQNWLLAHNAVDYLAATNAPSPVEHFWSLSVEEQFYLVWPLVIVALIAFTGPLRKASPRSWIAGGLVVLTSASLAYSIYAVATTPAAAYFVTPARAWEFGAGGILALFMNASPGARPFVRAAASWLGLIVIAGTLALYSAATPFPGLGAVPPVFGTLLVIWAGSPNVVWAPSALLRLRPVQWMGGISYSLYLWHWPLIVLVPIALTRPNGWRTSVAILFVSIALAYLTKRFVEDPLRVRGLLTKKLAWRSLAITLSGTVIVALGASVAYAQPLIASGQASASANSAIQNDPKCTGAPAALAQNNCPMPYAVSALTNPSYAETDIGRGVQSVDDCKQTIMSDAVMTCDIGDVKTPTSTVALIGDSHAGQYLTPLDEYGQANHIHFITYLKSWCSGTGAVGVANPGYDTPERVVSCANWGTTVLDSVKQNSAIGAVIFTDYTRSYLEPPPALNGRAITPQDFEQAWQPLLASGKRIIAMRDLPNADQQKEDVPTCVAAHLTEYDPCSLPRETATLDLAQDPLAIAAAQTPGVSFVDLTDDFCDDTTCHVLIGGLIVYFGSNHMTLTFSRTLASIVGAKISAALTSS
ncbi:acyltransferase family protein [Subtercola lobariae]|uniref:Acyltransferase n=1 Tax=Subtercola lobariae TaxID=1588641 RepID=A0A917BES5_9MICO|nr:acyltransferase family protein [Subtercola lobariae]GGF40005.1 acyltransferase [Subtercola lobariae]